METSSQDQQTRRIRMPRRWWTRALLVTTVVAAVAAPAAWANHQFSDVPNSNPHHNDISTIATAGITTGCGAGIYCPDQFVRRDQMASFLRRGLGRGGVVQDAIGVTATAPPDQVLAQVSIDVPGNGFVLVNAATDYSISGAACNVVQRIIRPASGDASWYSGTGNNAIGDTGVASTLLSPVTSGAGTRIFQLQGRKTAGGGSCSASAFVDMNAIWVPFNAAGTGVTSAGAGQDGGQAHLSDGAPGGNPEN